jgi:nitrate/nitrite transporter NarK
MGVFSFIGGEPFKLQFASVSAQAWCALAYLITFGSIVGFSAYVWLLKVVSPSRVSTYAYVNPVVAVFLGWALAGEAMTIQTMVAASVILVAVWVITGVRDKSAPVEVEQRAHVNTPGELSTSAFPSSTTTVIQPERKRVLTDAARAKSAV